MKSDSTLDADDDTELLSAYLDQELSAVQREGLERRLINDEPLRLQLRQLRRAWDLLDDLPEYSNPNFATTTMNLIAKADTSPDVDQESFPHSRSFANSVQVASNLRSQRVAVQRKQNYWFIATATCLVAAVVGLAAGLVHRNIAWQHNLRDIATAAVLPILRNLPDEQVALRLAEFPMLDRLAQTDIARNALPTPPSDLQEIPGWLQRLDPRDLEQLRLREDDILQLPAARRAELSKQAEALAARPDSLQRQRSGALFASLLQSLDSIKRSSILALPTDEQAQRIEEEAYFKIALRHANYMSRDDRAAIEDWIQNDFEPILAMRAQSDDRSVAQRVFSMLMMADYTDDSMLNSESDLVAALIDSLSDDAQQMLDRLPPRSLNVVIPTWVLYVQGVGDATQTPKPEDLMARYQELPDNIKERIDLADPSEVARRMSSHMRKSRLEDGSKLKP